MNKSILADLVEGLGTGCKNGDYPCPQLPEEVWTQRGKRGRGLCQGGDAKTIQGQAVQWEFLRILLCTHHPPFNTDPASPLFSSSVFTRPNTKCHESRSKLLQLQHHRGNLEQLAPCK